MELNKTYDFPPSNIAVPTDEASIAFGKHRAETLCQGCHGADMGGIILHRLKVGVQTVGFILFSLSVANLESVKDRP